MTMLGTRTRKLGNGLVTRTSVLSSVGAATPARHLASISRKAATFLEITENSLSSSKFG